MIHFTHFTIPLKLCNVVFPMVFKFCCFYGNSIIYCARFEKSKIFIISNSIIKVTENITVLSCVHSTLSSTGYLLPSNLHKGRGGMCNLPWHIIESVTAIVVNRSRKTASNKIWAKLLDMWLRIQWCQTVSSRNSCSFSYRHSHFGLLSHEISATM